jgi:hypothetical protein
MHESNGLPYFDKPDNKLGGLLLGAMGRSDLLSKCGKRLKDARDQSIYR